MSRDALSIIGQDPATCARIIAALIEYERRPERRFTTVRDDVTGPIVDALHASVDVIEKELANGLRFQFHYRSKIARDFIMSVPERPDHVWEPQTTRLLLHLGTTGGDAIIGGAYFGDQAIVLADAMRETGLCHAFEPDEEQAAMLRRNASLNGLRNVRVREIGLWSDPSARLAFVGADAYAGTVAADEGMPATTIDDYVRTEHIERVGLIMLDLEGGELHALRGAQRVLRDHKPHVIFEIHRSYVDWSNGLAATDIAQFLQSLGYTLLAIRDFQSNVDMKGKAIELVPIETAWLEGPPHGFNILAVRDRSIVSGPPFRIVPNVSPKLLLHRDPALHHPTEGL